MNEILENLKKNELLSTKNCADFDAKPARGEMLVAGLASFEESAARAPRNNQRSPSSAQQNFEPVTSYIRQREQETKEQIGYEQEGNKHDAAERGRCA